MRILLALLILLFAHPAFAAYGGIYCNGDTTCTITPASEPAAVTLPSGTYTVATQSGTSGGIPYYSSTTTEGSSALLTQYGIVYGGGAGNPPVSMAACGNGVPVLGGATAPVCGTDANIAYLDANQSWTKGQAVTPTAGGTQSAGGTYTPDFSASNSVTLTFGAGNLTIANPSNVKAGQTYQIALTQDGTGGRTVSWGTNFKWTGGSSPVLSTGPNVKDVISCWADTTTTLECGLALSAAGAVGGITPYAVGTSIASAATIAPTFYIFHVTGTSAISTITAPSTFSSTVGGCIIMIADAAWTTTTSGNIKATMTAVAGTQYNACYDGSTWYIK